MDRGTAGSEDASRAGAEAIPLVVDLEGTLIRSDTLVDALVTVILKRPGILPSLAAALWHGRGAMKAAFATHGLYQAETAPLRSDLLAFLQQEKARGRELHLATGADRAVAEVVAGRVGLFSSIECSRAGHNLIGERKLVRLRERFPDGFAYAGNAPSDLAVWRGARSMVLVGASNRTRRAALWLGVPLEQEFPHEPTGAGKWLKAFRLHQWSKNLLLFVPLLLAHRYGDLSSVVTVGLVPTIRSD